jgi:hypothetical protein
MLGNLMSMILGRTTVACAALVLATAAAAQSAAPSQVVQAVIPAPSLVPPQAAQSLPKAPIAAPGAPSDPASTPPASVQWVDQQVAQYRREVEGRVARGDLNPDEAERLIGWRRWQLQQQAAGRAPASQIIAGQNAADRARDRILATPYPRAYYDPYASPYYAPGYGGWYGPGPYVPSFGLCAGGIGRHYSAALCL